MRVALVIGHGPSLKGYDPGATWDGIKEHEIVTRIATLAWDYLERANHPCLVVDGYAADEVKLAEQFQADLVLVLHLNSHSDPRANRTLLLLDHRTGPTSKSRLWAQRAEETAVAMLGTPSASTGLLEPGKRGWVCVAHYRAPVVLVEPCFGSHPATLEGLLHGDMVPRIARWLTEATG